MAGRSLPEKAAFPQQFQLFFTLVYSNLFTCKEVCGKIITKPGVEESKRSLSDKDEVLIALLILATLVDSDSLTMTRQF